MQTLLVRKLVFVVALLMIVSLGSNAQTYFLECHRCSVLKDIKCVDCDAQTTTNFSGLILKSGGKDILLRHPVEVSLKNGKVTFKDFKSKVDIPIGKITNVSNTKQLMELVSNCNCSVPDPIIIEDEPNAIELNMELFHFLTLGSSETLLGFDTYNLTGDIRISGDTVKVDSAGWYLVNFNMNGSSEKNGSTSIYLYVNLDNISLSLDYTGHPTNDPFKITLSRMVYIPENSNVYIKGSWDDGPGGFNNSNLILNNCNFSVTQIK